MSRRISFFLIAVITAALLAPQWAAAQAGKELTVERIS